LKAGEVSLHRVFIPDSSNIHTSLSRCLCSLRVFVNALNAAL
jgi:hypothetical protein